MELCQDRKYCGRYFYAVDLAAVAVSCRGYCEDCITYPEGINDGGSIAWRLLSGTESGRHYVGRKVEETVKGEMPEACVGQEEMIQVSENNWVLRTWRAKRDDRRRTVELRKEIL